MSVSRPIIVRVLGKAIVPIVCVIGAHVAFGGASDIGGGLAGGVLAAAALVLYGLVFGIDAARRAAPTAVLRLAAALGFLALIGFGAASMMFGYPFLDFEAFAGAGPGAARFGAAIVQAGTGLVVFCSFVLIFYAIAGRVAEIRAEEW